MIWRKEDARRVARFCRFPGTRKGRCRSERKKMRVCRPTGNRDGLDLHTRSILSGDMRTISDLDWLAQFFGGPELSLHPSAAGTWFYRPVSMTDDQHNHVGICELLKHPLGNSCRGWSFSSDKIVQSYERVHQDLLGRHARPAYSRSGHRW